MNLTVLVGRLTRDPELRMTQSQVAVCSFTLAVDRKFKSASGEREADFIPCVAWRKTAELINQYVQKGHRLGVIGSIQTRSWDKGDGTRGYATEVMVEEIEFLQPREQQQTRHQQEDFWQDTANQDTSLPFDI